MQFRFSPRLTLVCLLLALAMLGMSKWQWDRHLQKQALISRLNESLEREPIALAELLSQSPDWDALAWRRVKLAGTFDFEHEFLLRNRTLNKRSGVHVITPLRIDGAADSYVLVDRGFIPLGRESREARAQYQRPLHVEMFGIVKNTVPPKLFAPNDPVAGLDKPWVDQWLRIHIQAVQHQLPYSVLPIYLETMDDPNDPLLARKIVKGSEAGRHDVLHISGPSNVENFGMDSPDARYPIATYDTTPPPDIHLGYVYEWAFMAILTLLIGLVMQFKRPRKTATMS